MENTEYSNEIHTPKALLSNMIRNTVIHANIPWPNLRSGLDTAIVSFHNTMNISVNDPRTTWGTFSRFSVRDISLNDETDGNPIHLLVIFITVVLVFFLKKLRTTPYLLYYTFSVIFAFLLLSFMLKWNPWLSRVHLPLFVITAPLCGIVLSKILHRKALGIVAILILFIHPYTPR